MRVPEILLSGDHGKISAWRETEVAQAHRPPPSRFDPRTGVRS